MGASLRETGSCPTGQAPAGLDASRCDPARKCDGCGTGVSSRNTSGLCRRCSLVKTRSPEVRARAVATFRQVMSDPVRRAKMGKAVSEARRRRMATDPAFAAQCREAGRRLGLSGVGLAAKTPETHKRAGQSVSNRRLSWCPPEYRDEYRRLLKNGMKKAEAKPLILEKARNRELERLASLHASDAAHFLSRHAPVVRCFDGGKIDHRGPYWRMGNIYPLTGPEIVERAMNKGWLPFACNDALERTAA